MTTRKKVLLGSLLMVGISAGVAYAVYVRNSGIITVQAGSVVRQDLAQTVSANGEIKPKKSVNISANTMGRIVKMPVKEGDQVRRGELLIRLESIQTEAEVGAAQAALDAAQTEVEGMSSQIRSNDAAVNSAKADIRRSEADLSRARQNLERSDQLTKSGLIPIQDYERTKTEYDIAAAQLNSAHARLAQMEAQAVQTLKQRDSMTARIAQQRSGLVRARDELSKTTITSPLEGIITYLPVNEGEIAIIGVQNQPGTVLMTIADLSVITAEVKVDETDIVNLRLGQEAKIKVDALGDRILKGHVSEVGNSALNRNGAASTGQGGGGGQEAKDFKVVITLDDPPQELRPGLSCTATIVTATRPAVLTIPIQAVTIREFDDPNGTINSADGKKKSEKEGVYIIRNGIATFQAVKTGITGTTDIEILEGLAEKDQIVIGPYQVLRTLADNTTVKIENMP